ncbi:hypothetical protein ACFL1N_12365 [Thermodesulfobacteriota bacterium]
MCRIFFAFPACPVVLCGEERQKEIIFLGNNNQSKSIRHSPTCLPGRSLRRRLDPPSPKAMAGQVGESTKTVIPRLDRGIQGFMFFLPQSGMDRSCFHPENRNPYNPVNPV